MAAAVLMTAAATAFAQPEHNDTLRTKTWSIYVQGGVSGFHNIKGFNHQYDRDKTYLAPAVDFGFMYHPRPWIRFGLDFGYTYLKSADKGILTNSTSTPNVTRESYTGTLEVNEARIQNRNFTHVASTDFTAGINFVEIWRERQSQWFNIWITIGGGYMHGWNKYNYTWAVDESLYGVGNNATKLYEHSYVKSNSVDNQFNAFYIPAGLSVEFDVIPQLTLAVLGQYKYFPFKREHTPVGIWTAGGAIRYNIVGKKQGFTSKNDRIHSLNNDIAEYEKQIEQIRLANAELSDSNRLLSEEKDSLAMELVELERAASAVKVVEQPKLVETEVAPSNFGVQIMAFRIYQHKPDEAIFFGDNPTIYKNGKLRRYVIFTDTLEAAKAKHQEVLSRYNDAFIVTIEKDGTVKPYK